MQLGAQLFVRLKSPLATSRQETAHRFQISRSQPLRLDCGSRQCLKHLPLYLRIPRRRETLCKFAVETILDAVLFSQMALDQPNERPHPFACFAQFMNGLLNIKIIIARQASQFTQLLHGDSTNRLTNGFSSFDSKRHQLSPPRLYCMFPDPNERMD